MLKLNGLDKYYKRGRQNSVHAVNNVTLELPNSGIVAIFGKSGCGKTTLLNVIGGLDKADFGSVMLGDARITPDASYERNINIGYIFQNYNLQKSVTVFENVAMSLRLCGITDEDLIERRVMAALRDVEMEKYKNRLPDALSGGQQQRVAIARAIVKNPKVILADEPTGNLDEQNTVLVMDLLRSIAQKHLVVLVTHEESLIDLYCDRVIEIVDGQVVGERENQLCEGYTGRSDGEIYLGDMDKSEVVGDICVSYFGDRESAPRNVTLISHKGTLYIKVDSDQKLKFVDKSAEVKIHEGSFTERAKREQKKIDPILEEPLQYGKTGRMYHFKSAVKSGWNSNFGSRKKGKAFLCMCLIMFSAIIVFMTAMFGVAIRAVDDIKYNYHEKEVIVSSDILDIEQLDSLYESGDIIFSQYTQNAGLYSTGINYMNFRIGDFETYRNLYTSIFQASAIPLPLRLMGDAALVCGTRELKSDNDVIISTAFADKLIESCGVDYIDTYEDLLYTLCTSDVWYGDYDMYKVVGVVHDKNAVYYQSDYEFARSIMVHYFGVPSNYMTDTEHLPDKLAAFKNLADGEVYVSSDMYDESQIGKEIFINGRSFVLRGVIDVGASREEISQYSIDKYGVDITEGIDTYYVYRNVEHLISLESYIRAMYGYESVDDIDPSMLYECKESYEQETKYFNDEYQMCLSELYDQASNVYNIIMTPKDYANVVCYSGKSSKEIGEYIGNDYKYSMAGYILLTDNSEALVSKLEGMGIDRDSIYTTDDLYDYYKQDYENNIKALTVMIVVVVVIMSLCMYLIMRSSLMGDIKEVGISRAIGVSKQNIIYRYFIEAVVLFCLTVLIGYIVMSAGIFVLMSLSDLMLNVVYYPVWLAAITLVGLFAVSSFCGVLPVRILLARSPSEILSKYDI